MSGTNKFKSKNNDNEEEHMIDVFSDAVFSDQNNQPVLNPRKNTIDGNRRATNISQMSRPTPLKIERDQENLKSFK